MKIAVYSDLHLEFTRFDPPADLEADVVVLAGDISVPGNAVMRWAEQQAAFHGKVLIHVAGNHEFYHREYGYERWNMAKEARAAGVHHLHMETLVVNGVGFLGCTLWTDFQLAIGRTGGRRSDPEQAMAECHRYLMDYSAIDLRVETTPDRTYRTLLPTDTLAMHVHERAWLQAALALPFDGPTVVITHHAPHRNSLAARYEDDWVSSGFVSELPEDFFEVPCLWIHGHTHTRFDYVVRNCRVVCNPRGYRLAHGSFEADFDPSFTVELGA